MADGKFKPAEMSVTEFLTGLHDPQQRADSRILVEMMSRVTGETPKMWSYGIVGFGQYHYKYASGREGDAPLAGFAPRQAEFSIYLDGRGDAAERDKLLLRLGRHRMGKGCLYVKRLDHVDLAVLEQLVRAAMASGLAADTSEEAPKSPK
jgi:hypothetical protein